MTAYLKRGDRIHLAFPVARDPVLTFGERSRAAAQGHVQDYACEDVQVVVWTANSSIPAPVVVAVFRDEE